MTGLNELLERVRSATGPDRGLDARIEFTLSGVSFFESDIADLLQVIDEPTGYGKYQKIDSANIPCFTASIDASLALVERVLPGTASERTAWRGHYRCALIETNEEGWHNGGKHFRIEATSQASEPNAILAALLSALISKESQS